jgi:hypothetical protein
MRGSSILVPLAQSFSSALFSIVTADLRRAGANVSSKMKSGIVGGDEGEDVGVVSTAHQVCVATGSVGGCACGACLMNRLRSWCLAQSIRRAASAGDGDGDGDGGDEDGGGGGKRGGGDDDDDDDDDDDEPAAEDGTVRVGRRKEVQGYDDGDSSSHDDDDAAGSGSDDAADEDVDAAGRGRRASASAGAGSKSKSPRKSPKKAKKAAARDAIVDGDAGIIRVQVPESVSKNPIFFDCVYSPDDAWVEVALVFPPSARKVRCRLLWVE